MFVADAGVRLSCSAIVLHKRTLIFLLLILYRRCCHRLAEHVADAMAGNPQHSTAGRVWSESKVPPKGAFIPTHSDPSPQTDPSLLNLPLLDGNMAIHPSCFNRPPSSLLLVRTGCTRLG